MSEIFTRLNDTIRKTKYLCFLMLVSSALQAQTKWYVNDASTSGDVYTTAIGNDANAGTASAPKLTLGAAFTAAAAGDIIYVDKGTFTGAGNKALTLNKAITIIGAGTGNTIFTSHTDHRFATIAANNVSIQNLQLYDFFLSTGNGQALLVNANVTGFKLTNVVMKKNYGSSGTGESIYLTSGSSSTFDGLFFSCSGFNGASGGGIKVNSCTLSLKNSAFSQSRDADGKGGAVEILGPTSVVTIDKTSFDGNSALAGGAISHAAGKLTVTNCCFNRNYIQGDTSATSYGGGHYYSVSTDANLIASFTNCKFQGAFFCNTSNPTGYDCQFSASTSNDGDAISLRGTTGTYSFDTCLFDNSNMPAQNFDNGLDFYVQPSGGMILTINNCKFANDLTNLSAAKARNIYITGTLNNTTQKVIVTNSGASATANRDGVTGNNFSLVGTLTTGSNSAVATSDATASCATTIAGCTITVNCATETIAPVITACAPNQTLSSCSGTLPDYRPLISAFDDCDFTITQSPAPGTSLSSLGNGNHTITFTVSDQSPNSADATCSMVLTLSGCFTCNPTLSYPNSAVCSASAAVTPTFSPAGGTFTSTAGLTIDAASGVITPSTSTAGTYTVTYSPNTLYPTCTINSTLTINAAPAKPTLACYETATFNTTTCSWDVTGTQPTQPTLACYETATFNTTTCSWDVTGTQPAQPTLACYETATFNTATCSWDVTGTQPAQPTLACYETATFNTATCSWDVTGTQPAQPTLACYETATFNTATCSWDVTGTQPAQPTLACYESATFNTATCSWDVTGTQPAQPTLACYESATFNTTTCSWDVTGTQPAQPTLACYETATFNTATCSWDVTGTQPAQPTLACYESATFNTATCSWDVTGTQPAQPTLACYETATFNTATCSWDVTGTQPAQPTLACYETATFNTATCSWDVTGTQPAQPTLACYETATFNTATCSWDVTGTQPAQPTLACYETATFNTTTCSWDVTGTQPAQPTLACYETATFNTATCSWDVTGTKPAQPTLACYETATFNNTYCSWDVSGTPLTLSLNSGTITCKGGTTDVYATAEGGTAPYSFSPSLTGLTAGTHEFVVTDANGCTASNSITITEPETFTATITSSNGNTFCFGGSTILTASAGSSYLWNTGATTSSISVAVSGTYFVTVKNSNGCEATTSIEVNATYCATACPSTNNLLQNGSFDNPSRNGYYGFLQMPYWTNAADGNNVEIQGANLFCYGCWTVPADGIQYIELNGNQRGNIHQDVAVLPNKSLDLSFMHRARLTNVGTEKLRVTLSDPTNNSNVYTFDVTAVYGVWKKVTGSYVTGPNQTSVRVRLETIASIYPGAGNYLDNVILNYKDCGTNRVAITGSNYLCASASSTVLNVTNTTDAVAYLWSTGATTASITVSEPGSYFVKVTFANGTSSISEPFVVSDFLTSASISGATEFCNGTSNTLTATGGTSYLWNTGATTASINVTNAGTYSVAISNPNGCNTTKEIIVATKECANSYCASATNFVKNGSFESYTLSSTTSLAFFWGGIPNWANLNDNVIEIHKLGIIGVNPADGNQYLELNGNNYGKLVQEVIISPNRNFRFSLKHRARSTSNETIKITLVNPTDNSNSVVFYSTGTFGVWKEAFCHYTSASTQSKVKVTIEAITAYNPGFGNLIDDVKLNYLECAESSAVIIGNSQVCNGSSVTLSLANNNNIVSYLWSNGSTNPIISVNQAGTYSVTVTLNNGNTITSSVFTVTNCNQYNNNRIVEEIKQDNILNYNVILYPNPTVSSFSINVVSNSEDAIEISIYDMQGRTIDNIKFNKEDLKSVTIGEHLPAGIYNVVVKQGENVKSQRLIKK